MTRTFDDLQVIRNLLPDLPNDGAEQALVNLLTWLSDWSETITGSCRDEFFDAVASEYMTAYDWS